MDLVSIHPGATERGQQCGMHVQDPATKVRDDIRRDEPEVARQDQQLDAVRGKNAAQSTRARFAVERQRGNSHITGPSQRAGIRMVARDKDNVGDSRRAER